MAVRIVPNKIVAENNGTAWLELEADAVDDLTGLTEIEGFDIAFGSVCLVIGTGDFYAYDSAETWKNVTTPEGA